VHQASLEKAFQAQVVQLARLWGWCVYHTYRSTRSPPGFPDLVLVRPPRLVFAELKSARGRLTPEQGRWLELLRGCPGVESYVWRPDDWDSLERTLRPAGML
jgi:hypothetical protein